MNESVPLFHHYILECVPQRLTTRQDNRGKINAPRLKNRCQKFSLVVSSRPQNMLRHLICKEFRQQCATDNRSDAKVLNHQFQRSDRCSVNVRANTPVRGKRFVLKFPDERRTEGFSTQTTYTRGSSAASGGVCEQWHATQRVLRSRGLSLGTLNRHLKKQRWKRKSRAASGAGRLVPVELAARKSPTQHEPSCGLAVVLPGGRRIEVHPDFDTNTFESLVSALERV